MPTTCPEKQSKSKLVEIKKNFKLKEHCFGYKTNHSSATLNRLLSLKKASVSFTFNRWGSSNKRGSLNGSNGTILHLKSFLLVKQI